jgi:hypothetical protein
MTMLDLALLIMHPDWPLPPFPVPLPPITYPYPPFLIVS